MKYDVSDLRSKSLSELATPKAPKLDFVFAVCDEAARAPSPAWPGQAMIAHWGLPDPAKAVGSDAEKGLAVDDCFRMLNQRIGILVNLQSTVSANLPCNSN